MSQENIEKNKAIVLLKKAGMPMKEIMRRFGKTDKRNFYRVWYRDCVKYFLPLDKRKRQLLWKKNLSIAQSARRK